MGRTWIIERRSHKQYEDLQDKYNDVEQGSNKDNEANEDKDDILAQLGIEVPQKNIDWDELHELNEHVIGWLYVPGTTIDHPVLQHPTDAKFYLEHNIDGSEGRPGCVYSSFKYNSTDFMDFHTVLYAHGLANTSIFTPLHQFNDAKFFEENKYMYIYTPETVYVYEIFGAYGHSDEHLLACYNTETEAGRQYYLDMVAGIRDINAHFRDGVEVTPDSHILTLSTCLQQEDRRWLVQGVLVNDPTLEEVE